MKKQAQNGYRIAEGDESYLARIIIVCENSWYKQQLYIAPQRVKNRGELFARREWHPLSTLNFQERVVHQFHGRTAEAPVQDSSPDDKKCDKCSYNREGGRQGRWLALLAGFSEEPDGQWYYYDKSGRIFLRQAGQKKDDSRQYIPFFISGVECLQNQIQGTQTAKQGHNFIAALDIGYYLRVDGVSRK